ncbi:glutamate--tRNA ligase [Helicobacter sp. MIT 21-1697]|uniref:glutamate--tRNA ligase n=1 Tax=Helicobacter sp. MIT 21-1697 TaxID=2993733 RepID=UPI00224A6065|nr:glutamate--tRNA ligase [Helicobacter sp. MIT 21-1697]MCX2716281.1 glutamate--tRNA ligase [Helicobacter sp. MIT 21-1697]
MLRFAPSPTGDMHIGNLRAAIFNFIIAKQQNQKFLIRIEDTDIARNIVDKDKEILNLLNLFGLLWDNLVYQSSNFERHRQLAEYLISKDLAFYCYCSKAFLESKRLEAKEQKKPFRYDPSWAEIEKSSNVKPVVRIRGASEAISFEDAIKGTLRFEANEIDSFVILKEDGIPTYNFACAVDDMLYDISFIVRGEDHVSNTPRQILIHRALGYDKVLGYAHLPIILGESGSKMSKRDNASSVAWLLQEGFLPQAIMNYLISMGNHTPTEIFKLQDSYHWFDIKNIAKSPVKFDIKRLRFLNREHLKMLNEQEFALLLESKDSSVGALGKLYLQEASTLNEIRSKIESIFAPKCITQSENGENFENECKMLYDILHKMIESYDESLNAYDTLKNALMEKSSLKGKKFFKPLRILLTGQTQGLELSELYPYLRFFLRDIVRLDK